jgi:predicted O-methyltransferase YrrM
MRQLAREWLPPRVVDWYRQVRYGPAAVPRPRPDAYRGFKLPRRSLSDVCPDVANITVEFPAAEIFRRRDMVMPHAELLAVAAICQSRRPRRVFEIGTYTGSTTLLMAMNGRSDAELFTLDLEPAVGGPQGDDAAAEPGFRPGTAFAGKPAATKIRQLYGDSRAFDYAPYAGTCDLVLVDADHRYDFVKADTEKAFRLLRPGGMIVWDDYLWEEQWPECAGVARHLDELLGQRDVFSLAGTRLAMFVDRRAEG